MGSRADGQNVDPLYCPSVLLPIRYTAHLTYCNIRPTTDVYNCIIRGLGQVKTISGPGAVARTGQGAERRGQDRLGGRALRPEVHLADVKPRASRSDGKQDGWAQVQKYTIEFSFVQSIFKLNIDMTIKTRNAQK